MNKGCKVALIGCGVLVLLVVGGLFYAGHKMSKAIGGMVRETPGAAAALVDCTTPAGYVEHSMDMMGVKMVMIVSKTDPTGMTIMLVQMPAGKAGAGDQTAALQGALSGASGAGGLTKVSKTYKKDVTIKGAKQSMSVQEGTDAMGQAGRSATVVFQGKSGTVMMMAHANQSKWDSKSLQSFLDSMK
ncbi:MAG: hypothetical protein HYU66_28295 [Armatimonadetes bacterium]|nr:hypothetical protein [Armatimonadota bacterium]